MIFRPYYLSCLSHASYLVADETTKRAAVVDPQRDVGQYLADAKAAGLSINHVILTHFHADFVSGHIELAEATGADIRVGARGAADYPTVAVHDGDALELGPGTRLEFLETPGHTPESVCVLVFDRRKSETRPHGVLTGDTLFIGDVGRPDLMASVGVTARELAGMLYESLTTKLLPLPDETIVYPAHGAGSLCGKSLGAETSSPLGVQRRTNYALGARTKDEFVRMVTADQPECPAYFGYDANLNRRARSTLSAALASGSRALPLAEVLALVKDGATVLDTRSPQEFAAAHLRGSVNVGLGGRYAQWCGTVLAPERPIVVVAAPGRADEAAMRLGRIGFDRVAGHLDDLFGALRQRPDLVGRLAKTSAVELIAAEEAGSTPFVLDVRQPGEWDAGHVKGAHHIPLTRLPERLRAGAPEIPRDRRVLVHCQSGYRSSIAASLLKRAGFEDVADLVGGYAAYEAARSPSLPEP